MYKYLNFFALELFTEAGYHLTLHVLPDSNREEILEFLQGHIPQVRELEGGLNQVKKAIHFLDWDASQVCLLSLPEETESSVPLKKSNDNQSTTSSNIKRFISYFFKSGNEGDGVQGGSLKDQESIPTVVKFTSTPSQISGLSFSGVDMNYLLPFRDEPNFPKLFKALDNSNLMLNLGIHKYHVKLHDMETAFSE